MVEVLPCFRGHGSSAIVLVAFHGFVLWLFCLFFFSGGLFLSAFFLGLVSQQSHYQGVQLLAILAPSTYHCNGHVVISSHCFLCCAISISFGGLCAFFHLGVFFLPRLSLLLLSLFLHIKGEELNFLVVCNECSFSEHQKGKVAIK